MMADLSSSPATRAALRWPALVSWLLDDVTLLPPGDPTVEVPKRTGWGKANLTSIVGVSK